MGESGLVSAIKGGMKGELDSITVYEEAASHADGEVGAFFLERADEEKRHYNWLLSYYNDISVGRKPEKNLAEDQPLPEGRSPLIGEAFLRRVGESRQLSAAISSAILLEFQAIAYYRAKAACAVSPALKSFFGRLVEWEECHYHDLLHVQEESERFYWNAARWEPF
jgi:rubrerythrin